MKRAWAFALAEVDHLFLRHAHTDGGAGFVRNWKLQRRLGWGGGGEAGEGGWVESTVETNDVSACQGGERTCRLS